MSFSNFFCSLDLNQITTFHWFINNSPLHIPNYLNQLPFFFSSTRATLFLIELHNFISYLFGYFHSSILIFSIQLCSIYKHIVAYKYPSSMPLSGFQIRNMRDNKMLFNFASFADWEPVLVNGSWSFNRHDILLQRVEEYELISNILFNNCLMGTRHRI